MTGKIIKTLVFLGLAQTVSAQDVIVKRDGSTILSKVLEVNTADIKYKKFSNQNGPTYTINISDVMVINYENGEKDTFNSSSTNTTPTSSAVAANPAPTPVVDYAALAEENLPLIREFNSHDVKYLDKDTSKKAGALICTLGIKEGSIVETPELKANFSMKKRFDKSKSSRIGEIYDKETLTEHSGPYMLAVSLKNKTSKTIYVDLGTSYFIYGEKSIPYFIPTSTTTTTGSTSGGTVNMGSVAGALSVGGTLGTLAGGVNVGGASSSSTSTTTYSQRVISIPPMASVSLAPQSFYHIEMSYFEFFMEKGMVTRKKNSDQIRFEDLKRGEKINLPQVADITSLSVHISYAFDEMISQPHNMRIDFYLRQVLGIQFWDLNPWNSIDYSKCPLIYLDSNPITIWK